MGNRKRHSAAPHGAPPRYASGAVRVGEPVPLGEALASALEPFGLGVAVVEPGTMRLLFASEALASLLGATVGELLALRSLLERVIPQDARVAEASFASPRPSELTLRLLHACGDPVDLDLSVRPFDREPPRGRALAIVFRGAGERNERESLRLAVGEAAESLRARDELFSIATHEIRTPLTSLRLQAQALGRSLERAPPDLPRARRAVAEVERHAERMSALADRLLDVSRIRSGRLEIERAPSDLAAIVREVAGRFGPEAAALGATIIIDGEPAVLGHWDALRLEQIVANLDLERALKFGDGNPIAVELRSIHHGALLTSSRSRSGGPRGRAGANSSSRSSARGSRVARKASASAS